MTEPMRPVAAELDGLAQQQLGLVTSGDLRKFLTKRQVATWIATGRLRAVRHDVYAMAGVPDSWSLQVMSAVLAAGDDALGSQACALRVWRASDELYPPIEITVPSPRWPRIDGVVVHSSAYIDPCCIAVRDGIPITSPSRTVIDLSGRLWPGTLGVTLDRLIRAQATTAVEVRRCFQRLEQRGRRRTTFIRAVLDHRLAEEDASGSDLEARFLRWIAAAGLPPPKPQLRIEVGSRRYYLDLAWPDRMIAVEIQGWLDHGLIRTGFDATARKATDVRLAGWLLLEWTSTTTKDVAIDQLTRAFRATDP